MLAFEAYVDEAKVCTASVEDFDQVSAFIACGHNLDGRPDERRIALLIAAMKAETSYCWRRHALLPGGRVKIGIVDAAQGDQPPELDNADTSYIPKPIIHKFLHF